MRILRLLLFVGFVVPMAALFRVPGEMAQEFVLGRLTDWVAERLGMNTATVDSALRIIVPILPFVAALALLMLYHSVGEFLLPPKQTMVREARTPYSILRAAKDALGLACLAVFVVWVLYAEYSYVRPAGDRLRFHDIAQLSSYDLRERAFHVAAEMETLQAQYTARRDEIFAPYNKQHDQWTRDSQAYDKAKSDYDTWHAANRFNSLIYSPSLGQSSLFGQTSSTAPNPEPPVPISPGPEPQSPLVTVDRDWQQKAEAVQEEAAAVWEEISHRLGFYPRLFQVPSTYRPDNELGRQVTRLRDMANSLH
jgi:hypothetical protein